MRIYFDNCCLQRPLDNQSDSRVRVETEAVFALLAAVQIKSLSLLASEALEYEISRIPDQSRRSEAFAVLALATETLQINDEVESLALSFKQYGLQPIDAIHLALASIAKADYFCTCDDKLFRCARSIPNLGCKVITLLNLITEIKL